MQAVGLTVIHREKEDMPMIRNKLARGILFIGALGALAVAWTDAAADTAYVANEHTVTFSVIDT